MSAWLTLYSDSCLRDLIAWQLCTDNDNLFDEFFVLIMPNIMFFFLFFYFYTGTCMLVSEALQYGEFITVPDAAVIFFG